MSCLWFAYDDWCLAMASGQQQHVAHCDTGDLLVKLVHRLTAWYIPSRGRDLSDHQDMETLATAA